MMSQRCTDRQSAISREATQRQKGNSKLRCRRRPTSWHLAARYRDFTVIKVTTRVVYRCIFSGYTLQTSRCSGRSVWYAVYKMIMTTACPQNMSTWHAQQMRDNKNPITCIILLQLVPSIGKIKRLQLRSCDHVKKPQDVCSCRGNFQ